MTETEQRHSAVRRRRGRRVRRSGNLMAAAVLIAAAALAGSGLWIWQALRGPDGEGVAVPDYVEQDLLPVNQWSRPGTTLERIDGVVIHYVGNPGTTAEQNHSYFENLATTGETYASSHFLIGLDGEVICNVPLDEIAYCTGPRNVDTISLE